tara:strand:+ start:106 stop:456 length:351 start_codon:yes stop_codon:yes gene_type:complete
MSNLSNINGFLVNKNLNLWDLSRELLALEKIEGKGKSMSEEEKEKRLSRRERFVKYRQKRLRKAIEAIGLCENMANKNSYEYTDEEAKVIIKNLQDALSNLRHAFTKGEKGKKNYF